MKTIFYLLLALGLVIVGGCGKKLERKVINPVSWSNKYGFVQGNMVKNGKTIVFTAGQVSVDKDGKLLHPNNMEKQMEVVMDNIEIILKKADVEYKDIVKFNYYTTDIKEFSKAAGKVLAKRFKGNGCVPATTLIGVKELFHPDAVVEIEAVIIK